MKRMSFSLWKIGALVPLVGALLAGPSARAALGAGEAGIAADQNALQATLTVRAMDGYSLLSMSTGNGLNVREYLDGAGVVFAVAWNGPARPALQQLLGKYYAEFDAALQEIRPLGLHRSLRIDTGAMRVELSGHMRSYQGRAYLPAAIPGGVNHDQLR